jgi:hypothetical protein
VTGPDTGSVSWPRKPRRTAILAHFELRKVALGVCARDFGIPCVHEHACIRCPVLRPDPEQLPRLEEIHANLLDRLREAEEQGWLG